MDVIFKDDALRELFEYGKTSDRKYKKICKSKALINGYQRAVRAMYNVQNAEDLRQLSFLHYEKLKHQNGLSSVRVVNGQVERLLFTEIDGGVIVELIEINSTHYGNKK